MSCCDPLPPVSHEPLAARAEVSSERLMLQSRPSHPWGEIGECQHNTRKKREMQGSFHKNLHQKCSQLQLMEYNYMDLQSH